MRLRIRNVVTLPIVSGRSRCAETPAQSASRGRPTASPPRRLAATVAYKFRAFDPTLAACDSCGASYLALPPVPHTLLRPLMSPNFSWWSPTHVAGARRARSLPRSLAGVVGALQVTSICRAPASYAAWRPPAPRAANPQVRSISGKASALQSAPQVIGVAVAGQHGFAQAPRRCAQRGGATRRIDRQGLSFRFAATLDGADGNDSSRMILMNRRGVRPAPAAFPLRPSSRFFSSRPCPDRCARRGQISLLIDACSHMASASRRGFGLGDALLITRTARFRRFPHDRRRTLTLHGALDRAVLQLCAARCRARPPPPARAGSRDRVVRGL